MKAIRNHFVMGHYKPFFLNHHHKASLHLRWSDWEARDKHELKADTLWTDEGVYTRVSPSNATSITACGLGHPPGTSPFFVSKGSSLVEFRASSPIVGCAEVHVEGCRPIGMGQRPEYSLQVRVDSRSSHLSLGSGWENSGRYYQSAGIQICLCRLSPRSALSRWETGRCLPWILLQVPTRTRHLVATGCRYQVSAPPDCVAQIAVSSAPTLALHLAPVLLD